MTLKSSWSWAIWNPSNPSKPTWNQHLHWLVRWQRLTKCVVMCCAAGCCWMLNRVSWSENMGQIDLLTPDTPASWSWSSLKHRSLKTCLRTVVWFRHIQTEHFRVSSSWCLHFTSFHAAIEALTDGGAGPAFGWEATPSQVPKKNYCIQHCQNLGEELDENRKTVKKYVSCWSTFLSFKWVVEFFSVGLDWSIIHNLNQDEWTWSPAPTCERRLCVAKRLGFEIVRRGTLASTCQILSEITHLRITSLEICEICGSGLDSGTFFLPQAVPACNSSDDVFFSCSPSHWMCSVHPWILPWSWHMPNFPTHTSGGWSSLKVKNVMKSSAHETWKQYPCWYVGHAVHVQCLRMCLSFFNQLMILPDTSC